jgi:hypothetical protein
MDDMSISKPMKLIALRMDEEEKARLEHLASERDVSLSVALREGARLYLGDVKVNLHRRKGEPVTWHGVRRRKDGTSVDEPKPATSRQVAQIRALEKALVERGLGSIRRSWDAGASPAVIVAAIGQWLRVIGQMYTQEPTRWDLMLVDYVEGFDVEAVPDLRRDFEHALTDGVVVNPGELLDTLEAATKRLVQDLYDHEEVRRSVLISWGVFRKKRDAPTPAPSRVGAPRELRVAT